MSSVPRKCMNSSEICVFWGVTSTGMFFYPHVKGHVNEHFFHSQWRYVSFPPSRVFLWAWFGPILMHFDAFHFSVFLMMLFLGVSLNFPPSFRTINSLTSFYFFGRNEGEEILDSFYRAISCLELSSTSLQAQNKIRTFQLLPSICLACWPYIL